MNRVEICSKIVDIVSTIAGVEEDGFSNEALFVEDLGLDSLRVLEILAAIENEFHIMIEPEKLVDMKNVNSVAIIVEECINGGE